MQSFSDIQKEASRIRQKQFRQQPLEDWETVFMKRYELAFRKNGRVNQRLISMLRKMLTQRQL